MTRPRCPKRLGPLELLALTLLLTALFTALPAECARGGSEANPVCRRNAASVRLLQTDSDSIFGLAPNSLTSAPTASLPLGLTATLSGGIAGALGVSAGRQDGVFVPNYGQGQAKIFLGKLRLAAR
ncbi:hypothetical protein HaLaN_14757, partial [Haematococcus lacustris]